MKIIAAYDNTTFSAPIEYTLRFYLDSYRLTYSLVNYENLQSSEINSYDLLLSYGKQPPPITDIPLLHIAEANLFSDNYLKQISLPQKPIPRYKDLPIIFPSFQKIGEPVQYISNSQTVIQIDLIASAFFFLSRYEEYLAPSLDEHQRFPSSASLAAKEDLLHRLIVDEYTAFLKNEINKLCSSNTAITERSQKDFNCCITFDVDMPFKYTPWAPITSFAEIFRWNKSFRQVAASSFEAIQILARIKKDPYFVFDYLLDLQKKYFNKATYFFLSGKTSQWDPAPQINRRKVARLLAQLNSYHNEIGLHASYNSCQTPEQLAAEKLRLQSAVSQNIAGVRQHFLRLRVPETWRAQQNAGFIYDATLGFADAAGFRAGTSNPFRPFDLLENRQLNIWTIPLCVMDATLKYYQNLDAHQAKQRIYSLIDTVKQQHGTFTILWHNSSFDEQHWPAWPQTFEDILKYLTEHNAAFLSLNELIAKMSASHEKT